MLSTSTSVPKTPSTRTTAKRSRSDLSGEDDADESEKLPRKLPQLAAAPHPSQPNHTDYAQINAVLHQSHRWKDDFCSQKDPPVPEKLKDEEAEEQAVHQKYASINSLLHKLSMERGRIWD